MAHKMSSYHFDVGDSTKGAVGFSANINARSREKALARLKELLPDEQVLFRSARTGEYITIYFNRETLTSKLIDEIEHPLDDRPLRATVTTVPGAPEKNSESL